MGNQEGLGKKKPSALRSIAQQGSLEWAWNRMLQTTNARTRRGFGVDGESIADISPRHKAVLRELSTKLLSSEGYAFDGLKPIVTIKKSGKKRIICVPTVRDRIVQRAVLKYLTEGDKCGLSNRVSFGFVPGKGVRRAAEEACTQRKAMPFVYKTDISTFFDSLDRRKLEEAIKVAVKHRSVHKILFAALSTEISDDNPAVIADIRDAGITTGRGVRQGMPLSPFFANVYLRDFDKAVVRQRFSMVRYADDLIFLAASAEDCKKVHDFVVTELAKIDLQVPPLSGDGKTRIYGPSETAEFLGVELFRDGVSYVLRIGDDQIRKACDKLRAVADLGIVQKQKLRLADVQRSLEAIQLGYIEAYKYTANLADLENRLNAVAQKSSAGLIKAIANIDVSLLSPSARTFLGV